IILREAQAFCQQSVHGRKFVVCGNHEWFKYVIETAGRFTTGKKRIERVKAALDGEAQLPPFRGVGIHVVKMWKILRILKLANGGNSVPLIVLPLLGKDRQCRKR